MLMMMMITMMMMMMMMMITMMTMLILLNNLMLLLISLQSTPPLRSLYPQTGRRCGNDLLSLLAMGRKSGRDGQEGRKEGQQLESTEGEHEELYSG